MYLIFSFIFLFSSDLFSKEVNVYDIISKNSNLSTFKDYLDKTGLDKVLQKKIPYNWTIYAPSNNAFENTPKELEKFVKDVVIVKEDIKAENGVVHIIDCIMFIQPSSQDSRLSSSQQDSFPITSCCMQTESEISLWKQNTKKIVY